MAKKGQEEAREPTARRGTKRREPGADDPAAGTSGRASRPAGTGPAPRRAEKSPRRSAVEVEAAGVRASARKAKPERARPGADERRAALLAAAYATIAERGLEGLRTREVAARAGVNISTLHYHFGSKEALVVAVIAHVRDKFVTASARHGGGEGLAAHLASAGASFREDRELGRVLQELVLRGQRDRSARAAFRALHEFWAGMVEELLREGVARGELRADLDPAAGARVVTSFVMGAMTQLGVNAKAFEFAAAAEELARWLAAPPRRAR